MQNESRANYQGDLGQRTIDAVLSVVKTPDLAGSQDVGSYRVQTLNEFHDGFQVIQGSSLISSIGYR